MPTYNLRIDRVQTTGKGARQVLYTSRIGALPAQPEGSGIELTLADLQNLSDELEAQLDAILLRLLILRAVKTGGTPASLQGQTISLTIGATNSLTIA